MYHEFDRAIADLFVLCRIEEISEAIEAAGGNGGIILTQSGVPERLA